MTKIWKAAAAIGCTAVMVIGLSACDFSLFGNNSKSAYQVAVENGFQGSEEDWLKSLHGADGKDGGDLDIEEIYAAAAKNGYEGSFLEFLKEYLSADINEDNNTDAIAHNLMSSVKIYSAFGNTVRVGGGPLATTKTTYAIAQGSGVIYDLNRDAGKVEIVTGVDLLKSIFSGYPGAFVGIGNCLVTPKGEGKADVTYVNTDSSLTLPAEISFPDSPSLAETIDFFNSLA